MKLLFVLVVVIFPNTIFSQPNLEYLKSMVAVEYQFSEYTQQNGIRNGFQKFIAEDGILFRPSPVNGKDFLKNQKPGEGILRWFPIVAGVSNSGDLGYTSGPWEFKKTLEDTTRTFGNFCTVWELQPNGKWKFVIDYGNGNSNPGTIFDSLKYSLSDTLLSPKFYKTALNEIDELTDVESKLNDSIQKSGLGAAYKNFIGENSRLLRKGLLPIIGASDIINYLKDTNHKIIFETTSGKMSNSGDMGYTYGKILSDENESVRENYFMRIWKRYNGTWLIEIEVADL